MTASADFSDADAKPLLAGMLLYPGFTLLDLAGPQVAFALNGRTLLLWKTLEPVASDTGVQVTPTATFADCPRDLDVLFLPGGFGTGEVIKDGAVIDLLATVGPTARYVTSVCTGSLVLGMAGLLEGYRAATQWTCHDELAAMGAVAMRRRVVADRNERFRTLR